MSCTPRAAIFHFFLPRDTASAVYMLWPCVCLSVTSRCSTKTAKRRIIQTTPLDSTGTSFLMPNISAKFDRGQPLRGRQMQVGWVKIGDFRQITGHMSKTVQDRRTYSFYYDTRCYFNVRSKAGMSQLNLPHGTDN